MKSILRPLLAGVAAALLCPLCALQAAPLSLRNETLEVSLDDATGRFSLRALGEGRLVILDAALAEQRGRAAVVEVDDAEFGHGRAIETTRPGGDRDSIQLFPRLPFALVRGSHRNAGTAVELRNKIKALSCVLDFGRPPGALTTLGTGGLLPADKNPGSYAWLAVADPANRHGVVVGWLTHERASGVVFSGVDNDKVTVEARAEYGRLRLAPGEAAELETLALGCFEDTRLGLEAWADAIARIQHVVLPPQPAGYCTWYSSPFGGASDEKHIAELGAFAARQLAPFGFSVVQIDDRWQAGVSTNGPNRNFTTHAPAGPYPGGMKAAADGLKAQGLTPGIWFMPFAGTYYDPFFKDHQDWFVQRDNGAPYETDWGGTCLDMTQPGAREHLRRSVGRIGGEWGFQYFKMDGLWTGTGTKQIYVNTGYREDGMGDAVFHDPSKTGLQAYRSGLRLAREAAGPKTFILGCCIPQNMRSYGGAMGLVNAMRIGPDNGPDWESLKSGPTFGTRHYFLHGRVWYNDPDPVYVRPSVPLNHARLIASWVAVSGQLNLSSEWLPGLPPERLDILKRSMPGHGLRPRPVDLFDAALPSQWLLTDTRGKTRRDVVALFNWDAAPRRFDTPVDWVGLNPGVDYVAFDFWGDALLPTFRDKLPPLRLAPESCAILAIRPVADHPELLSTSRHVTQGIVDVTEETWDGASMTLKGRSKIVAGDPYELRIVCPRALQVAAIGLATEDSDAGVTANFIRSEGLVRVKMSSPGSREVGWSVRFAR